MPRQYTTVPAEVRFWQKVDKVSSPIGCWLWTAARTRDGYGVFTHNNRFIRAHRFIWQHTHGHIPDGLCVRHKCDVPNCVNLAHLELGTNDQNMADMARRRRAASGERHAAHKLTEDQARELLQLRSEGWTTTTLAARYGISQAGVWWILSGKNWKHLSGRS